MNYEGCMTGLAFLVDVTAHLNNRNEELWCKNKLIAEMYDSIKAYKVKLRMRENQLKLYSLIHFPQLKSETLGILTMPYYYILSFRRYLTGFQWNFCLIIWHIFLLIVKIIIDYQEIWSVYMFCKWTWVPKCLDTDKKRQRCQLSEQLLEFFLARTKWFPVGRDWWPWTKPGCITMTWRQSNNQWSAA
jgi:hypothetical protein